MLAEWDRYFKIANLPARLVRSDLYLTGED